MNRRGLRLELVAGLGIALAMPALVWAAEGSESLATRTTLSAETHDQGDRTKAALTVSVIGDDGLPASGAVAFKDHGRQIAGVTLDAQGQATATLPLTAGDHSLRAVYLGDAAHQSSSSQTAAVNALAATTPSFVPTVSPAAITLTAGQSGNILVSVTPENAAALTAPMFVTLSCSGLPDEASCTFTPENVEILSTSTAALTSTMVIQTQKASSTAAQNLQHSSASPIAFAILFPGALGLIGLAWGGRRRRWLMRASLLTLVGLVTLLGTTACNPRYNYLNHGPIPNPATPAGTYQVTVVAQSNNGITAITVPTTLALTVQ
jgi:hypothetical protein